MADVDLEALEAGRPERLDRHRDHLGVRLRLVEPEQLHARLVELAHAPEARGLVTEHVGAVGEAVRLRPVAEARGGDAGDLRRHVGAEREHPPGVPVDELEHPLLERLVRPQGEDVEELERGGHHLPVPPQAEHAKKALLQAPETGRLVGEVDLHPGRELRLKVPPVHSMHAREPGKPSEVYGMPRANPATAPRGSVSV